jgi:hypothetical protein
MSSTGRNLRNDPPRVVERVFPRPSAEIDLRACVSTSVVIKNDLCNASHTVLAGPTNTSTSLSAWKQALINYIARPPQRPAGHFSICGKNVYTAIKAHSTSSIRYNCMRSDISPRNFFLLLSILNTRPILAIGVAIGQYCPPSICACGIWTSAAEGC